MLDPTSAFEYAWRSTLIDKAQDIDFDSLAYLYGLHPRPSSIPIEHWREALKVVALGRRGTFWNTFRCLEAMLQQFNTSTSVEVTVAAPFEDRIISPTGLLTEEDHSFRLVRLAHNGKLYYTAELPQATGIPYPASNWMRLSPVTTSYWNGANWDLDPLVAEAITLTTTATFLPFRLLEPTPGPDTDADTIGKPCLIQMALGTGDFFTPPTYLVEVAGAERSPSPGVDEPFGGHLLPNEISDGGAGDPDGPFPLYLTGANKLKEIRAIVNKLLASGVHIQGIDLWR